MPGAPTPHQERALARVRTTFEGAGNRFDAALWDALAHSGRAVQEQLAALGARTESRSAEVLAAAAAARARVRAEADSAQARLTQAAETNTTAIAAWRDEAVVMADRALQDRQDAVVAGGQQRADHANQLATQAAVGASADAQAQVQHARTVGEAKAASTDAEDTAVRSAQATAARELTGDTADTIATATEDTAAGMQAQGAEVAVALHDIADQVANSLAGHRHSVVSQLGEQESQTVSSLARTASTGGRALAERREGALAAINSGEREGLAVLHEQSAVQRRSIVRAGREAAEHLTTAAAEAGQELARDVEQTSTVFATQPVDEETSAAVADAFQAQLNATIHELNGGLTGRATEIVTVLGHAAVEGTGQLDTVSAQAGSSLQRSSEQGAQGVREAEAATEGGLADTVEQTRTAGGAAVASFTQVLDQNMVAAEPGLDDLLSRHESNLSDQTAEVRSRTAEPTASLGNRIETAQQRAAERASRSWLGNQLADLWETVTSPEFLVGLAVGLLVGAIIILSAGTATPFVIMAAGIAAGAAGAAAGTMTGNIREGKTGWDIFENVGRNALIGGLAGGVGAGIYLFGAGLAAGLGLTGGAAFAASIVTLEVAAIVSNTVANVASGRPWDENLLTAMLLAPLFELIAARVPGLKGRGAGDEPPRILPDDPTTPRPRTPPPEEGPTPRPVPDEEGPGPRRRPDEDGPDSRRRPREEIPEGTTNEDVHIEDLHEPARRSGEPELDPAICFPGGTLVATPYGDRRIEQIEEGSLVYAFDFTLGEAVKRPVLQLIRGTTTRWTDVQLDRETLRSTPTHRFWVESAGSWFMAEALEPGMAIRLRDGGVAKVVGVRDAPPDEPEPTFNLSVDDAENYFVGAIGALVHNITASRMAYLRRGGYRNYVLIDAAGTIYYSGMCRPGETAAGLERRHGANHNRFNAANGDRIEFLPGTREYGEARLLEHQTAVDNDTIIGRDGENYRGNRQDPLASNKRVEYLEYEQVKQGCG